MCGASVGGVVGTLTGWTFWAVPYDGSGASREGSRGGSSGAVTSGATSGATSGGTCIAGVGKNEWTGSDIDWPDIFKIRYTVAKNRFCGNVNRPHRSNGILLEVNLSVGSMVQLCWDPDCRSYRSPPKRIPESRLPALHVLYEMGAAYKRGSGQFGQMQMTDQQ